MNLLSSKYFYTFIESTILFLIKKKIFVNLVFIKFFIIHQI
jgi:hypothetical protein